MKVIVLNCGSSSIKYQLFDMPSAKVLAKGLIEKIGLEGARVVHKKADGTKVIVQEAINNHKRGIEILLDLLTSKENGCVSDIHEIDAVGHRVVHAGEKFGGSVLITNEVIEALEDCIDLAPLHNPANLEGIYAAQAILPEAPQIGVFDTAFHQTMPAHSYMYAIAYDAYEDYKIRRYGFHGSSHKFVSARAAEMLQKPIEDLKIVTCHLGNGGSVAAIEGGISVDTSMGMTPIEGLMMGTRCGDFDIGAAIYLAEKEKMTPEMMNNYFNKKCGVEGISGVSSDMRDVEDAAAEGNERAQLALDMYYYRVLKYIGSYMAAMGGIDAIVFTGGIGENDALIREHICEKLAFVGVDFDYEINKGLRAKDTILTKEGSKVAAMLITTDEELVIARDTFTIASTGATSC